MALLLFTLGLLLSSNLVVGDFSFNGSHGPLTFEQAGEDCTGHYQSPINIEEKYVVPVSFPKLQFSSIETAHTAYIANTGHTVIVQSFDSDVPSISGGPLNSTYVFRQVHFHWGAHDDVGSEHLINNRSFSMELHAIFWNKAYDSYEEALKHDDGLTVLGYMFQAQDKPNQILEPITSHIPEIKGMNSNVTLNNTNVLNRLLVPEFSALNNYFSYKGSLTTPPCLEVVQWLNFAKPQHISHEQLALFRSIHSHDDTDVTENSRPVQPIDGRIIYRNKLTMETLPSEKANPPVASGENVPSNAGTVNKPADSGTPKVAPKEPEATAAAPKQANSGTMKPMDNSNQHSEHSGQQSIWTVSPFAVLLGVAFLLSNQ